MGQYNANGPVERYNAKRAKVLALSKKIFNANCLASCPVWLSELKRRMEEFRPCFSVARGDDSSAPSELQALLAGSGTASLTATWKQGSDNLYTVLKNNGYFKAKGDCAFDVRGIEMTSVLSSADEPMDTRNEKTMNTIRSMMFGEDCNTMQQSAYIAELSKSERQFVDNFMTKINKILQIHEHAKNIGESNAEERAELVRVLDEPRSSAGAFLESDAESAIIFFIIGFCVFLLLLGPVLAVASAFN